MTFTMQVPLLGALRRIGFFGFVIAAACSSSPSGSTQSGRTNDAEPLAEQKLSEPGAPARTCQPTPPDSLGPFYEPDAPVRSSVGTGYHLSGTVRSSGDCSPIPSARIELWLTGPDGKYDDDHRATVLSAADGTYDFESNFPPGYGRRPPHIHIRVTAEGHRTLVTQHYPAVGRAKATFDLVLVQAP